jgi:hypothetical protein
MPTADVDDVRRLVEKGANGGYHKNSAVGTTTTIPELVLYAAERPGIVKKFMVVPEVEVVGSDNTNYSTLYLFKRTATTPSTAITFFTALTKTSASGGTGTLTQWKRADLSAFFDSDITKRTLAEGDVVTFRVDKTATTGATFPVSALLAMVGEVSD